MKPPAETPFRYRRGDGTALRGVFLPGAGDLIVFLSGFRSVHTGEKARAFAEFARQGGHACLRFDYLGHGISEGDFVHFRVSEAVHDTAACIAQVRAPGQRLFITGSSMGGWIALEAARRRAPLPDGLLLIAPALDFVSRRERELPPEMQSQLARHGHVDVADAYVPGTHYRVTREFLDDALRLEPGNAPLEVPCPVAIVHGTGDDSVPVTTSRALATRLPRATLMEIPGGDHRLTDHVPDLLCRLSEVMGLAEAARSR